VFDCVLDKLCLVGGCVMWVSISCARGCVFGYIVFVG